MYENIKPYRARNNIVKKSSTIYNTDVFDIIEVEEYGYLEISVYDDAVNEPIKNAVVKVYLLTISGLYQERGEGKLITSVRTEDNGYAPLLRLPVLNRTQKPIKENVNSIYMLTINAEGYYGAYAFDIQIYPNVTTSYSINLHHVDIDAPPDAEYEFIIEPRFQR